MNSPIEEKIIAGDYDTHTFSFDSKEEREVRERFMMDCFEELNIVTHPKADQMWNIAWKTGAGHYYFVYETLRDLAELIK